MGRQDTETCTAGRLLQLPDAPADLAGPVKAWRQDVEITTCSPVLPDRNPMFLGKGAYTREARGV